MEYAEYVESVRAGIARARARGAVLGRPVKVGDDTIRFVMGLGLTNAESAEAAGLSLRQWVLRRNQLYTSMTGQPGAAPKRGGGAAAEAARQAAVVAELETSDPGTICARHQISIQTLRKWEAVVRRQQQRAAQDVDVPPVTRGAKRWKALSSTRDKDTEPRQARRLEVYKALDEADAVTLFAAEGWGLHKLATRFGTTAAVVGRYLAERTLERERAKVA